MGDMTSGGAPRIKSIVAAIQTVANAVLNGNVRTNLRRDDGTEIGTSTNPLVVDIGGDVPDTLDLVQIAGTATAVGAGVANTGTIRVVNASDDVNLSGILAQLDITLSALRDALRGTGSKDFTTLEADAESILAQLDVDLSTRASEATLTAQLDITQSALRDAVQGDLETVQSSLDDVKAATEAIQTNVAHIDTRSIPEIASGTGTGAIDVSYLPGVPGAFYLCAVTIHLSAVPATAGDLAVVLDAVDGAEYDTVLFRVDPSDGDGAMDIVYIPITSIPCVAGDVVNVNYANDDGLTYGVRIVAREV